MPGGGDVDMAAVGQLLADRGRCRILLALADGRALPASVLAAEAGVWPSTASGHLRKLTERSLIEVLPTGRYRYYRLAGPMWRGWSRSLAGWRRPSRYGRSAKGPGPMRCDSPDAATTTSAADWEWQ